MSQAEADATGWRGTHNEGGKLKEAGTDHWYGSNTGATNDSGFTGLPGGSRPVNGFSNLEISGYWWSATDYSTTRNWVRGLDYSTGSLFRNGLYNNYAASVRCLKD